MKTVAELKKKELTELVEALHNFCFYDEEIEDLDPDKEIDGGDLVDFLLKKFEDLDMLP